ncbi:MAG: hypothetical protein GY766_01675 [Herbaspirillum sp.]|uniref:hypothetical protein n=1 Tax=Herbaspirillum sp. TaxID=1890675 RepID=UPI002586A285|nr:hypothetical protein [Herbaspirillum sp.]MCP3653596.1 hypothetical protein [Herbaspirillum sp.]
MNNLIKAADELAGAIDDERNMVCQDFGMQQDASLRTDTALTAYRTARNEQGEVKVKPLVWDGLKSGPYVITIHERGIADLHNYAEPDEDGYPERMKGGYLTLVSIDDLKAAAQADYETRIRSALEE